MSTSDRYGWALVFVAAGLGASYLYILRQYLRARLRRLQLPSELRVFSLSLCRDLLRGRIPAAPVPLASGMACDPSGELHACMPDLLARVEHQMTGGWEPVAWVRYAPEIGPRGGFRLRALRLPLSMATQDRGLQNAEETRLLHGDTFTYTVRVSI